MSACCSCNSKKKKLSGLIQNQELLRLRLSQEEKEYYTELYYNSVDKGKVTMKNFPPLLGMLGTELVREFADRIFLAFSSNKEDITLCEYLKYIDIYHYGDDKERCKVTCKLIDKKGNDKIYYNDFKDYIKLILNAVKKVNPGFSSENMSDNDIKTLFLHIAKKGEYFTSKDFEEIYEEKPELVSWIDYFKNNSEDVLIIIHDNINNLLKGMNSFFDSFLKNLNQMLKNDDLNFENLIKDINGYCQEFQKIQKRFLKKTQKFSIRNIFDKLSNNAQDQKKRDLLESMNIKKEEMNNNIKEIRIESDNEINPSIENFFKKIKKFLNDDNDGIKITEENLSNSEDEFLNESSKHNKKSSNNNNLSNNNTNVKITDTINLIDTNNRYDDEEINGTNDNEDEKTIIPNNSEFDFEFQSQNEEEKTNNNNNNNNRSTINNLNNALHFNHHNSVPVFNTDLGSNNTYIKKNNKKIFSEEEKTPVNTHKKKTIKIKFSEYFKKNYIELNKFFLSMKEFIENAKETITSIHACYRWISESYLNSHIKRIVKTNQNKKENNDKFTTQNVNAKMRKVKKKIIKAPDQSFKILLNMIMGIQIAVQSTPNYKIDDEKEDLKKYLNSLIYSVQTINFSIKKQETFFLKEYAGIIFNNIRKYLGFDKEAFISSISPQDFITELMISSQTIFEELISTGKSGSLFYYTRDGKFIVKTIGKNEYKFLKKILPNYYKHLKKNPLSLLPKFLGCYQLIRKVKKKKEKFNFIVMQNVFSTNRQIHIRFDLKGSKIGRRVLKGTKEDNNILNKGDIALKDLDLETRREKAYLGEKREIFLEQLIKDTQFLSQNGAIDYSLLLGIHYINRDSHKKNSKSSVFPRKLTTKVGKDENRLVKTMTTYENYGTKNININTLFHSSILNNNGGNDNPDYKFFTDETNNSNISINNNNNNNNNEDCNYSFKSSSKRINDLKVLWDYNDGGILSLNKDEIYFLGIIDILTEYNCKKSTEHFFKVIRYCSENMSCVPPLPYMTRFNNYMENICLNNLPTKDS